MRSDLCFSDEDKKENIRWGGDVSKMLMGAGHIVFAIFISPFAEDGAFVSTILVQKDSSKYLLKHV